MIQSKRYYILFTFKVVYSTGCFYGSLFKKMQSFSMFLHTAYVNKILKRNEGMFLVHKWLFD